MTASVMAAIKGVIVADDTAFVRDRFKAALESAGHRAKTVSTGQELLALLRQDAANTDLIVLDLRLPQGRGVELLRSIRRINPGQPPVVVFSGTIANAAEVRDLGALGVAGYMNEYTAVQHIVPSLAPHLFPDHYNRRYSPRVSIGVPVAYRFGNTIAAAVTLNVSERGLAVRTTSPLEVGTPVKVRFRLPSSKAEIDTEATVVWAKSRVGMGLQFASLQQAQKDAIDGFVHGHFFSNRKA
jgi:uncharacterized protein (TIGR02266 family)